MRCNSFVKKTIGVIIFFLLWYSHCCDSQQNVETNSIESAHHFKSSEVSDGSKESVLQSTEEEDIVLSDKVLVRLKRQEKTFKSDNSENSKLETKDEIVNSVELNNAALKNLRIQKQAGQVKPVDQYINVTQIHSAENVNSAETLLKHSIHLEEQPSTVVSSAAEDQVSSGSQVPSPEIPTEKIAKVEELRDIEASAMSDGGTVADHSQHTHSEAMPSFDEWKKMMLAEQEKDGHKIPSPGPPGKKIASQKRRRNYSSYECGAKIVASNPEAEGTSRILNELVDEYMLNPCKAKIWFVIELCETVQASQIELANFELFSSCPKDFAVYSSDHFPTRDWILLGTFTTAEQRVLQSFALKQEGFGKFIKIELLSHYGKEHYCPLSIVRIFGTSMVDEYEEMETLAGQHSVSDDDLDRLDILVEDNASSNIFGSATDAVFNIVKKAAQVLGQHKTPDGDSSGKIVDLQNISEGKHCSLHTETSENCSDLSKENVSQPVDTTSSEFLIPPSSFHRSLFQHLRHCNQCVSTASPKYYSLAQPQCRFFQAALGPVMFKAVCDWFRDHQLVVAEDKLDKSENIKTVSKHSSSPDTVISVIIDSIPITQSLPTYSDSASSVVVQSEKIYPELSTEKLTSKFSKVTDTLHPEIVKLESLIQPTKTFQLNEKDVYDPHREVIRVKPSDVVESLEPSTDIKISQYDTTDIQSVDKDFTNLEPSLTPSLSASVNVKEMSITVENIEITGQPTAIQADDSEQKENETVSQVDESSFISTVVTDEPVPQTSEEYSYEVVDERPDSQKEGKLDITVAAMSGLHVTVGQKESVFVRMNNRIKSLELNMSLSSQYLQELSQRYRRQMEEMQRAFNRTIGTLNDTARKAAERDVKQQELIGNLQARVANLSVAVDMLLDERSSMFRQAVEIHLFLIVVEIIIIVTVMSLYVRRISLMLNERPALTQDAVYSHPVMKRRNSDNVIDVHSSPTSSKVQKRSASEEGLTTGQNFLIVEPAVPLLIEPQPKVKKKHKKKNKGIPRSVSNPSLPQRTDSIASVKNQIKKEETCVAGVIFNCSSGSKVKNTQSKKQQTGIQNHVCENCDRNVNSCVTGLSATAVTKAGRKNSAPLKNLTNGGTANLHSAPSVKNNGVQKEKFTFKKLLRLQKRDSI